MTGLEITLLIGNGHEISDRDMKNLHEDSPREYPKLD
jgi:hypothetical protein